MARGINREGKVLFQPLRSGSHLIAFGALSQMLKARGAYDKPFWIITVI